MIRKRAVPINNAGGKRETRNHIGVALVGLTYLCVYNGVNRVYSGVW